MSVFATDNKKTTLLYNSNSSIGKQTLGYVTSMESELQAIDISKTTLGDTVWVSIAKGLNKSFDEILSKEQGKTEQETGNFTTDDWLKILKNNPERLQDPILIKDETYVQISSPSDVVKYFDSDSAGIEKK